MLEHDYDAEYSLRESGRPRDVKFISCKGLVTNRTLMDQMRTSLEESFAGADMKEKASTSGTFTLDGTTIKLEADGTTYIMNAQRIDRGYEHIVQKLTDLGAVISRVNHTLEYGEEDTEA